MEAFTFYYPYELVDNDLIFGKSWKTIEKMQIFEN